VAGLGLGFAAERGLLDRAVPALAALRGSASATPVAPSPRPAAERASAPGAANAALAAEGPPDAAPAPAPEPKPASRPARAASAASAARPHGGRGVLDVTAPGDADVLLDGRLIGRGSVKTEIREGAHRIEVRRGAARVAERFTLAPGETWTYEVTPTN